METESNLLSGAVGSHIDSYIKPPQKLSGAWRNQVVKKPAKRRRTVRGDSGSESGSDSASQSSIATRVGSHPKSYSAHAFTGSVEMSVLGSEGPNSHIIAQTLTQPGFWDNEASSATVQLYMLGNTRRAGSVFIEDLIIAGTLVAIWNDLEHDVLVPITERNLVDRRRHLKNRFVFNNTWVLEGHQAESLFRDLRIEQTQAYLHRLEAWSSHLGRLVAYASTNDDHEPFIIAKVRKAFACGMVKLRHERPLTYSLLQHPSELVAWDDPRFTQVLGAWLSNQVKKQSGAVVEELISRVSLGGQANVRVLQMSQQKCPICGHGDQSSQVSHLCQMQ